MAERHISMADINLMVVEMDIYKRMIYSLLSKIETVTDRCMTGPSIDMTMIRDLRKEKLSIEKEMERLNE